jgi:potassium channel subfamily K
MHVYVPAVGPGQTYSQGFWHGVIAAVLYWIGSIILMINMLGYFLGKYPQHFDLDDSQRTLILQTMLFFFWLAIGAAVFQRLCGFSYADALYFCDVTVLTIGFGDITSTNDAGRGFIFPYTIIGIIFLGLMINSIRKFASTMSREKVIKAHARSERARTFGRTVTSEKELRDRLGLPPRRDSDTRKPSEARRSSEARPSNASRLSDRQSRGSLAQYGRFEKQGKIITFHEHKQTSHHGGGRGGSGRASSIAKPLSRDEKMRARSESNTTERKRARRREKLLLLEKEKDRFDAMREIQANTRKFKQYYALSLSVLAFAVLWFAGAVVFMVAEHREQDMSYFEALYFCYVSLLTIGYGDFSPKSNVGKPFFVVWSLIAVPTMTILISDMGDTVVAAINRGTFTVAEWTVLPRAGLWHDFLEEHPQLKNWLAEYSRKRAEKKRLKAGFEIADPDMDLQTPMAIGSPLPHGVLEELAEKEPSDHDLARRLAQAIKKCAHDIHVDPPKKYAYEEWVEFTRLIRFSAKSPDEVEVEEFEEGVVEWDWIGEDSPMLADATEAEWILERLCESLNRYTRKQARHVCVTISSLRYLSLD